MCSLPWPHCNRWITNWSITNTTKKKGLLSKDRANQVGFVRQWNILLLKTRQIFLTT